MKKPNFFILGAPKCGTTSMANWLAAHPQIFMSPVKEPHFFNFDYGDRGFRNLNRYEKLFEQADTQHSVVGEASTRYLYSRTAVPAILGYAPESRFMVVVRNPVDMAYSLHEQKIFDGDENVQDFESAWRLQNVRAYGDRIPYACTDPQLLLYGRICCLGAQIERLYDLVPRERVLLVNLDHIREDPSREYQRALSFLGVEDDDRNSFLVRNAAKRLRFSVINNPLIRLNNILRGMRGPHIRLGLIKLIQAWNTKEAERKNLTDDFKKELRDYFLADIELLESLSGWDLFNWK